MEWQTRPKMSLSCTHCSSSSRDSEDPMIVPYGIRAGLILFALVVGACACTRSAPPSQTAVSGVNEDKFRSFIQAYLAHPVGGNATILLGDLPPRVGIPFPQEAVLIGSVSRPHGEGRWLEALIELRGIGPTRAERLFREAFEARDWSAFEFAPAAGSVHDQLQALGGTQLGFCEGEERLAIVTIAPGNPTTASTSVRVTVAPQGFPSPCDPLSIFDPTVGPLISRFGLPEPFPRLTAPLGAQTDGPMTVATGLASASRSHTVTDSDATNDQLLEHYGQQLDEARWRQIESGVSEVTAWSHWRFEDRLDRPWTAVLTVYDSVGRTVVDDSGPPARTVTVEAISMGHSMPRTLPTAPTAASDRAPDDYRDLPAVTRESAN